MDAIAHEPDMRNITEQRAHQRLAEAPLVALLEVPVGGDDCAQVLAKLHVGGRAVIGRPDADHQELAGDVAGLLRHRLDQRFVQRRAGQVLRIEPGDPKVTLCLTPDDGGKRFEDGRDQDRPERVRFELGIVLDG